MAVITLAGFKGEAPAAHPAVLPDGYAQTATSTRLESGAIKPVREATQVHDFGAGTFVDLHKHLDTWLAFEGLTHAVNGPIEDSRLYYTVANETPKMRLSDGTTYALALPAPTGACTAQAVGTLDEDLGTTRVYTYTYVTAQSEESPPAALSNEQIYSPGMTASLTGIVAAPSGRGITGIRIYMSETSSLGVTGLYYVDEIAPNLTSYSHDPDANPIQEAIASTDYDPPRDEMRGIISLPNGMMAAFAGRTLCFCEPYIPHAWPAKYELNTDHEIVGLAAFGNTLAVMTIGTPYICMGNSPDNMVMERVEETMACVSAQSIVDMGYAAIYASHNGLVMISGQGAKLITKGVFTREQWIAFTPSSIAAGFYDGKYVFTYDNGAGRKGIILDVSGQLPFVVQDDIDAEAFTTDPLTGDLYYLDSSNLVRLYDDEEAALRPYEWKSKLIQSPSLMSFGAVMIEGEPAENSPTMTGKIYTDGNLIRTVTSLNDIHRLPVGWFNRLEVEVSGNATISRIVIAGAPSEMAGG